MPRLPRDLTQEQVIRALVRLGGIEDNMKRGKGSHRIVVMPNRHSVDIPRKVKTGLLSSVLKDAEVTVEEFIDAL